MQKSYGKEGYEWVASQRTEGLSLSRALLGEMISQERRRLDELLCKAEGRPRALLRLSYDYERFGELLWLQGAYRESWEFFLRGVDCAIPIEGLRGVVRCQFHWRFKELDQRLSKRLALYKRLPNEYRGLSS